MRAYITNDQTEWDLHISSICNALRNRRHESTGFTPHYLVFGQHMIQHANDYTLLKTLDVLPEGEVDICSAAEHRNLLCEKVQRNLETAHERNEETYNKRSRFVNFVPGQEVFRRLFTQSDFSQNVNAKLSKQWAKARIVEKLGSCTYRLEDMRNQTIKLPYHAKDLKQ